MPVRGGKVKGYKRQAKKSMLRKDKKNPQKSHRVMSSFLLNITDSFPSYWHELCHAVWVKHMNTQPSSFTAAVISLSGSVHVWPWVRRCGHASVCTAQPDSSRVTASRRGGKTWTHIIGLLLEERMRVRRREREWEWVRRTENMAGSDFSLLARSGQGCWHTVLLRVFLIHRSAQVESQRTLLSNNKINSFIPWRTTCRREVHLY